jgi:predicted molibdopterin-dependent oxidoreductase YjgC
VTARFVRLAETGRPAFTIDVDGRAIPALEGDTVLTAMMTSGAHVRVSEFGPDRRAGFCVMAACQDCWVWTVEGGRLRACSTPATPGLRLSTAPPEATWPNVE